ncbi:DUF5789 family protein [Halocalculus aciditolerans]|uniref:DUF2795 domain-containing protein n=1 Tax=Halocalculus aciditolerans TaxID=1383812 RepID=A0A830FCV7_9EURY|nr:hypothetical protein [Halocalculus aciditolerans]GGL62482.1 hypothetical protein GCM10009039_20640 [Halocalculus aciditolerans]
MARDVKLKDLEDTVEDLAYPMTNSNAREELDDVVLVYADGDERLSDVLARIEEDVFDDPADLVTEVMNALPTEAVGEPGQSEGDA